jgi:hypothetical protein
MCKKPFIIPIGDYGRKTFWVLAAKTLPDVDDIARRIKMFLFIIKGGGGMRVGWRWGWGFAEAGLTCFQMQFLTFFIDVKSI